MTARVHRGGSAPRPLLLLLLSCVLLGAGGCPAAGVPMLRLVSARDVAPADGPPAELEVRDLGSPDLAGRQSIAGGVQDGVAVIGELLLVRGQGFGRRPRVTIDGRTASQLARTVDGVLVRVPWGVRPGSRRIEVHNGRGSAATTYPLRRYVLATVPSKDEVHVFELGRLGLQFAGAPLSVPGARLARYSADGRIAYVSGRTERGELLIATVNMIHAGGPRVVRTDRVPGRRLIALAAAARAPLAVVISDTHLVFVDLRDPRRPALFSPVELPPELVAQNIVAADMDAGGRLLALLLAVGNEVRIYDVTEPGPLKQLAATRVLPKARAPLVRALRFSVNARTIWVISGDNADSLRWGRFPLRLTVIRVEQQQGERTSSFGVLSVWRSLDVPHRAAPVDLAVARGQPLASGRTVQVPPQNAAVFITAHDSKLLALARTRFDRRPAGCGAARRGAAGDPGASRTTGPALNGRGLQRAARILKGLSPLGTVVRTDIAGAGGPLYSSDSLLGSIDITFDSQLLLVAGARVEVKHHPARITLVYGVSTSRVFGDTKPRFIALATVDPESLPRPFMLGTVAAQP